MPSNFLPTLTIFASLLSTLTSATTLSTHHLTTLDGTNYAYDYLPAQGSNTTLLLLHGIPGSRSGWQHQIPSLTAAGHGIIAPDILGHGDSDAPLAIEAYNLKRLSGHLVEMMDQEGVESVVGVGHDMGSIILSRAVVWFPERFSKLAFLAVGYIAPGIFFDIDALNAFGLSELGYMQAGYWYFFNSNNAAELVAENLDSFHSLAYPLDNSRWALNFAQLGTARTWLSNNVTTALPSWLTPSDKSAWIKAFSRPGAAEASLNYYKALMRGVQDEDEKDLTDEDRALKVPVLSIGAGQDLISRADLMQAQLEPWAGNGYTHVTLDAGHWVMFEDVEGVNEALRGFLDDE